MSINKWIEQNTKSLIGKRVAVTGSTGGLGRELVNYLLSLGASLVLVDRNRNKQLDLVKEMTAIYADADITLVNADLENMDSVKLATDELLKIGVDVFIHNAGAYSIPRHTASTGFDNVFQINYVSPYYMIRKLLPHLDNVSGHVVAVGSIAHNYSATDGDDIDFAKRTAASKVYGNAKRYLMYSLPKLFEGSRATLSIVHPGISLTGITAHYPKLIYAIIKYPMKLIFMHPRRAVLSIVDGVFRPTSSGEWIGPALFGIWGMPKKVRLSTADEEEIQKINERAENIFASL